jgi:hypothetical protein
VGDNDLYFLMSTNTGNIEGTITDHISGLPIENATIQLVSQDILLYTLSTNSSGFYSTPFLDANNYTIRASATDYQNNSVGVSVDTSAASGSIPLEPDPGSLTGKITDSFSGDPIENAAITVSQYSQTVTVYSNDSGDYIINGLSPYLYNVSVVADTYEGFLGSKQVVANKITTFDISLDSGGGTITGNVTNKDTTVIIQGALIQLQLDDVTVQTIQTDQNGNYTFRNLALQQYVLIASAADSQLSFVKVEVADTNPITIDFALDNEPGSVSGRVTARSSGHPLSGATIKIKQGNITLETDITDNNGDYNLTGFAPGTYNVYAQETSYQTTHTEVVVEEKKNMIANFALAFGAGVVKGVVSNGNTSTGLIPGAHVKAIINNVVYGTAITTEDGEYSIPGLGVGHYILTVGGDNYRFAYKDITIVDDQVTTQDFTLVAVSSTVNGTITDTVTGLPIAGAIINASEQGSSFIEYTVTESDGSYSLRGLFVGTFIIDADKALYIANDTPSFDITAIGQTLTKDLSLYPENIPPVNLTGSVLINSFLLQEDRIHKLEWGPTSSTESEGYRVYRNGVLIANVALNTAPLVYEDHNTSASIPDIYEVTSVNTNGSESSAGTITLQ